jgi:hypothetical protein
VDLAKDPANCGQCGRAAATCVKGTPGGIRPMFSEGLIQVISQNSLTDCGIPWEGYPERSAWYSRYWSDAPLFMPFHKNAIPDPGWIDPPTARFNAAYAWDQWKLPLDGAPQSPASPWNGYCAMSDSWTTTSGYNALNYFIWVGMPVQTNPNNQLQQCRSDAPWCLMVGGATGDQMWDPSSWNTKPVCIGPAGEPSDGPAGQFDDGGTAFWLAASGNDVGVYVAPNCTDGIPGTATCPLSTFGANDYVSVHRPGGQNRGGSHTNIAVNPCTHNAVVAYRTQAPDNPVTSLTEGDIELAFVKPSGEVTFFPQSSPAVAGVPIAANDDTACPPDKNGSSVCTCPTCSADNVHFGGSTRFSPRVHIVTKYVASLAPPACLAYLAYDTTTFGSSTQGTNNRYHARLTIFDITDESAPQVRFDFTVPSPAGGQTWMPTVSANSLTDDVGFFFYADDGTHCATTYAGYLASDPLMGGQAYHTLSRPFPTWTTGDYVGAIRRGLPGGYLFPTWLQMQSSPATCAVQCSGQGYQPQILGTEVLP